MPFTDIEDLSHADKQFLMRASRGREGGESFTETVTRAADITGSELGKVVRHELMMGRLLPEAFRTGFGACGLPKAQAAFDEVLYAIKPALENTDMFWARGGCEVAALVLAFPPEDRIIAMRAVLNEMRDHPDRANRASFGLVAQLALAEAAMARGADLSAQ